jgi:PAS domain S-box-containing protein
MRRKKRQPPAGKLPGVSHVRTRAQAPVTSRRLADVAASRDDLAREKEAVEDECDQLRQSVAQLESALARYADLYDTLPVAYVTVDFAGIVREINAAGLELLGSSRRNLLGLSFTAKVARDDRRAFKDHLRDCKRDGRASSRLRVQRADGVLIPVELFTRRAPGQPVACRTVIVELSDNPELTREHRERLAEQEATRQDAAARATAIAVVGHELRAPLAPLLAAAAALERVADRPDEVRRLAAMIRRNVLAEGRLVDDIVDVNRLVHTKMELRCEPVELDQIVREALENFAAPLRERQLWSTVELEASNHLVEGDRSRLGQALGNLIGNAVKFTPPGGRLSIRSWNRGAVLAVEVSDSGVGLGQEELANLFTPFWQAARGTRPRAGGGLGLGLAIVKGIVELHGGTISAISRGPDQGTRFVIELPTIPAERLAAHRSASAAGRGDGHRNGDGHRAGGARPRILLIEDNADTAEALRLALGARGYDIEVASNGAAALSYDLETVDLVISDLSLPDLPGRDLLTLMRQKRPAPIKAIALSGFGSDLEVQASREAGFLAHLTKPIELEVLTSAIERAINGARS